MENALSEKLTGTEFLALDAMLQHPDMMSGLRKIFAAEERYRLQGMRSEALAATRPGEIVKYAAESRVFAELESLIKKRMEQLAPQRR